MEQNNVTATSDAVMRRIRAGFIFIGIVAFVIGSASVIYSIFIFSKVVVTEEVQSLGLVGTLTSNAWIIMFWSVIVAEIFLFFLYKFIASEHKTLHKEHYNGNKVLS